MKGVERVGRLVLEMTVQERLSLWRYLQRGGVYVHHESEVCGLSPEEAFYRARHEGATDVLREVASLDPFIAWNYATLVDEDPHEVTRAGASRSAAWALVYARQVDKEVPHEVTRRAVCQEAQYATAYARFVDRCFRPDTWAAVKGTDLETLYRDEVGVPRGVE